jgi:rare lipoprotein A
MLRGAGVVLLAVMLAACGGKPAKRPPPPDPDYTPGGLYKPGVPDSGPDGTPDISAIPEPVPRSEPRARYGNRSPYTVLGRNYYVMDSAEGYVERGTASWYGNKFHGRATSSLEPYDMYQYTAAHKSLPLPSYARVTNLDNGRSVVVRVNDRGPFHGNRLIDLSYVAAVKLGMHIAGTAPVEVRALMPGDEPVLARQTSVPEAAGGHHPPAWLQVGAFRDKDNARRVERQLRDAGIDEVELRKTRVDRDTVWRVRVGPISADALSSAIQQLMQLGFSSVTPVSD